MDQPAKKSFVPRAKLAQSNFHHKLMGSSHRHSPETAETLHRPHHEFMDDAALAEFVHDEIGVVRQALRQHGDQSHVFVTVRDTFLGPDLKYLHGIGRLPSGINLAELEKEFEFTI